ncbi:hypothetical protein F5146DRAFT_924126 [Armillaria mellea]|nr:hypothetical protein F5146DRAFT_924126 [Armillaria mellea]
MGNILSCSVLVFKSRNGIRDGGKEQFYQMIMSMSIQIIWNTCCEQVIQNDGLPFLLTQICNRWLAKVCKHLELDCLMTQDQFGKKALQKDLVLETWSSVIKDEHRLSRDWTETDRVLVGME